jgi:cupin 2 domain-containing protein
MVMSGDLLTGVPVALKAEQILTVLHAPHVRIERIVSTGQASPPGFWYDQAQAEFVVLLAGAAGLLIAGESEPRILRPGSYVHLPAHCRHRVQWTSTEEPTVWLALYLLA